MKSQGKKKIMPVNSQSKSLLLNNGWWRVRRDFAPTKDSASVESLLLLAYSDVVV